MSSMNIIDFCEKFDIAYFGIDLVIKNGAKTPQYAETYGATPKQTDFALLSKQQLDERKLCVDYFNFLAIDTRTIKHIDVDFENDVVYNQESYDFVEHYSKLCPYFKSVAKDRGKHIFFNSLDTFGGCKRPQTNMEGIEILNGQWSFIKCSEMVHNVSDSIFEIEEDETIEWRPEPLPNLVTTPLLQGPRTTSKSHAFLMELADIISFKYIDEYDSWTRLIWALKNDEDNDNLDIAIYLSKKSPKYDEDVLMKLWESARPGITLGTYIYVARKSNELAFFKLKTKNVTTWDAQMLTDVHLARLYLSINPTNHIFKQHAGSSSLFTFHHKRWKQECGKYGIMKSAISRDLDLYFTSLSIKLNEDYSKLIADETVTETNKKMIDDRLEACALGKKFVNTVKYLNSIADAVVHELSCRNFDDIEFDTNGYLFAFRDKVFDLNTLEFVDTVREDYILTTCGYDYEDADTDKMKELDDLFDQIFPDPDVKQYYLHILSSGLYGVQIEQLFIANGSGGNGKGVVNELMCSMLGPYGYVAPNSVLINPMKQGSNPEVANMDNKRFIIFREPEEKQKINLSVVKELTGGAEINARQNYANNTTVRMKATMTLECNKKCKFDGRLDESASRRIRDILFNSTFTDDEDRYNDSNLTNTFKANTYYKKPEFQKDYRMALFGILVRYIRDFHANYECSPIDKWIIPYVVRERTKQYIESSDDIKEWFNTVYEPITERFDTLTQLIDSHSFVSLKDVYLQFKISNYYLTMGKKEVREWTKSKFIEYIKSNVNFKSFFKEILKSVNGCYTNVLIYHREKISNEEYESEEEDCDGI